MPLKKPLLAIVSSLVFFCALAMFLPTLAFAQGQYTAGSIGVDVSYPDGSATIPTTATFGIVGVTGGLTYTDNTYLAAEAGHFTNLSFYANTGLNASSTSTYYQQAVAEATASGGAHAAAYYYGYNAGQAALAYATAQGENVKTTWWLDVETANTWNSDTALNRQSLQGEYDALQAGGATLVGVYSTTYQWGVITGGWQNGWPSWGATALPTATQALTYSTGHEFSGGPSYLMQYRPTGAVIDYDVACLAPTVVTSFTPSSGPADTPVTISGSGFTGATAVRFNGTAAASLTVNDSGTQITATVPAGATSGAIAVTTPAGTASSVTTFTVLVKPTLTLKLSGLTSGALTLGKALTATATVTPADLGGAVTLTVQREQSGKWLTVSSLTHTFTASGTYSATIKPASVATYRIKATIAQTVSHTAATTMWQTFTVSVVKPTVTLKLSGLTSGVLRLGKVLTASGKVMPTNLGGKVTLTVQREQSGHWLAVTTVTRPLSSTGTYAWAYSPAQRATYRVKTTITKTTTHSAAATAWLNFMVK